MRRLERGWKPGTLSVVLAATLSLGPGVPAALAGSNAVAGSVELSSDPDGAAVYLDGQFEGTTPLRLEGVAPGPHRVRVVKQGFLENRRVVDVRAGAAHEVRVPLTEHRGGEPRYQVDPSSSGGGGGSKKALLIGVGAAAVGAGLFLALRDSNDPPVAGSVSTNPSTGLASATSISISAQGASDPDGDTLTFTWDFGDGASGSGATTSHTYADAGTYTIRLTVSDGEESATATGSVTVRDLTGHWSGSVRVGGSAIPFAFDLTQSGGSIGGTYSDADGVGSVSGNVSPPLGVSLTVNQPPFQPFTFSGTANAAVSSISGTVFGFDFTMSR